MVEKFGTEGYKFNAPDDSGYQGGGGDEGTFGGGKSRHGGVGGRGSKSNNHKEAKNANKRRFEKNERERTK